MTVRPRPTKLACLLVLLVGCGPSGPKTYPISGTVSWNGQPVPKGHIVFASADGSMAPDAGAILDGRFAFRAKAGHKRVEVYADRESGPPDPVMHIAPRESYIPAEYNAQTTLTAEVVAGADNEFNFDLRPDRRTPKLR
jgi:hypothetical protein